MKRIFLFIILTLFCTIGLGALTRTYIIVIDLTKLTLTLNTLYPVSLPSDPAPLTYRIGAGKLGKEDGISYTPLGTFKITYKTKHPWYKDVGDNSELISPYKHDKRNKYGTRILGLSYKRLGASRGLAIHGTNEPDLIPGYCSNMCIRMKNADIEELYNFVTVDTQVIILP